MVEHFAHVHKGARRKNMNRSGVSNRKWISPISRSYLKICVVVVVVVLGVPIDLLWPFDDVIPNS